MTLVFLVPIRHPDDCRDPDGQQAALRQLFASMAAQTTPDWRAVVTVNKGQRLPPLPARVQVVEVDFPANSALKAAQDQSAFYKAIRLDKGRRLRRALAETSAQDHVMVTDDDDLLSNRLVAYLADRHAAGETGGHYIDKGYSWPTGSDALRALDGFHHICGTSIICPAPYYDAFPMAVEETTEAALAELGSHRIVFEKIQKASGGFSPVPFRAAIYRIAHTNASQTDLTSLRRATLKEGGLRAFFSKRGIKDSARLLFGSTAERAGRKVPLTAALRDEFFSGS